MKKILFLLSLLLALDANAQTLPAQRVRYGEHTADIQPAVINDRQVNLDVKNPNGNENLTVEFQEVGDGQIKMVVRDKNTGKIVSSAEGVKDKYVKSNSEFDGIKQNMDLNVSNRDELTGTAGYSNKSTGESLFAKMPGNGAKLLNQTKKGYNMSLNMRGIGTGTVTYTQTKTKEVICTVNFDEHTTRAYDAHKKLVAEWKTEEDKPSAVYDETAWQKCEKVVDIFNEDGGVELDVGLSDIISFFGF